jgi:hypothetical protein
MRLRQRSFFGLAKRSFAFWFGGIWLFCGAPFLIIGIYVGIDTLRQHERFRNEAQVTQGMVLTKRISRDKERTNYWVGYRFSAQDGTVVKTEAEVSSDLWDRLVEREPVRVTYLPDRPQRHRIEGEGADWMLPLIFTVLGLVFVPLGGFIFFKGLSQILRELRLQSEGTMVEAVVVDVAPAEVSFNGVPQWRIHYRYQDHGGRPRTGESALMAPEKAQAWKAGDRGSARFDPRAPNKSIWVGRA